MCILLSKRKKYRKAMMRTIKKASDESLLFYGSSKTDGLRVIKRFEVIHLIKYMLIV